MLRLRLFKTIFVTYVFPNFMRIIQKNNLKTPYENSKSIFVMNIMQRHVVI